MVRFAAAFFLLAAAGARAERASPKFKAVAFDYFVLFNPDSIVPAAEREFPGKGQELAKLWRVKLFEYGFLRSIAHDHRDFFQVTEDALLYATEAMKLDLSKDSKQRLLEAWLNLEPWPDARSALVKLKEAGVKIITIANFSPMMLKANADHAGITPFFDELLSTEVNRTYKPEANAYELGMKRLKLKKSEIVFAAFGGWDVYGAKKFGYTTFWCNRFDQPLEKLGTRPDATSHQIDGLLKLVLDEPVSQ